MAKKKASSKEQEEKPKPIDRTPIIVAIIGLVGTITVTLITVFANRPAETRSSPGGVDESGVIPAVLESSSASSADGSCLDDYFAAVPAEHRLDLQAGISTRIPDSTDGLYGIRFFENGSFLGGMQFMGTSDASSFSVISVIDAGCAPVDEFGNLERPSANGVIGNWENLGLTLSAQNYRLRMGWYSGDQIELIFQED
jgi:hypothetical protein